MENSCANWFSRRASAIRICSKAGACTAPARWARHWPHSLPRLAHKGLLQIDDFDVAARQFLALVNADLQMSTLFGATPSEAELESAARNAVCTFMRAYGAPDIGKLEPAAINAASR